MPFASKAQARFMFATHPQIAKRWAREFGVPSSLPQHVGGRSQSNESPSPKVARLPRRSGTARDFGPLSPGPKARMKLSVPASELEAMKEGPVTYVPGSRHRELGAPLKERGMRARDSNKARR